MKNNNFSYEAAREELENILAELENGETGIDDLAAHVRRASELIRLCREKLRKTEKEVQDILQKNPEQDTE
jgi:exodeoxyribonuclease VII small subunit